MRRNSARRGPCLLLVSILALLWFTGCADTGGAPKLEEHLWTMTTIQDSSGAVVYCPGESADSHEGAEILSLTCEAANGALQIAGESQTYTGVYRVTQSSPGDALYEITVGGEVYTAVTGMTTYADGSESPTFLINTPDYTLTFTQRSRNVYLKSAELLPCALSQYSRRPVWGACAFSIS